LWLLPMRPPLPELRWEATSMKSSPFFIRTHPQKYKHERLLWRMMVPKIKNV
jgi:hypothetical protein